jgi:hypothetical protein
VQDVYEALIGVRIISESLVLAVEPFRIFLTFSAENEGKPSETTILSISTAENWVLEDISCIGILLESFPDFLEVAEP